ncbi:MAG: OmpH family outer membrane protein [Porticoccaceae bacterium]|nr:OmpH family outer membrane protein [Porticoccaceae bacterium]
MKTVVLVLVSILSLASVTVAAETKIAVIDIQQAMFASDYAQNSVKVAQESADFVALRAKAEGSAADLQSLGKEAETKRLTWSAEQVTAQQKKMSYAKADYDLAVQKIQGEQKQLQQKIMQELSPQFQEALAQVVQEEGITLLLRSESVIVASPENNLTAKVIDRLNQNTRVATEQ